jgi:hypothetical protein
LTTCIQERAKTVKLGHDGARHDLSLHNMFSGSWSLRKLRATVLNDIWLELTFFTLVATGARLP